VFFEIVALERGSVTSQNLAVTSWVGSAQYVGRPGIWEESVELPPYYDYPEHLVIRVDPLTMSFYADVALPAVDERIAESIGRIVKIWDGLKLGWVGTTADEVEAFNHEWSAAITKLFGSEVAPQTGVLSHIGVAAARASRNYAEAEDVITKMFEGMSDALTEPDPRAVHDGNGGGYHDPGRDVSDGPITEHASPR